MKVPAPWRWNSTPSAISSAIALRKVVRDTSSNSHSARSPGSNCDSANRPASISRRNVSTTAR
jgi:hypothetical protein